jgi:hypothetical protein
MRVVAELSTDEDAGFYCFTDRLEPVRVAGNDVVVEEQDDV